MNFIQQQFDKILLVGLFAAMLIPAMHDTQYAQRSGDLILGALLGLITGKLAQQKENQ